MATEIFNLRIYNINIKISTNSSFTFENLKKDFMLYLDEDEKEYLSNQIKINVFKEKIPYQKVPPLEAYLYNLGSICYRSKGIHYIDYAGKGLMIYDFKKESADIYSEDENLLYEKDRIAILSRAGELMENNHIHRIHAVGLAKDGRATICLLPMEAGKTTLGLGVLRKDSKIKLICDDICFIDSKNYIYPFILRIGVRDRHLVKNIPEKYITKIYRNFYGEKYLIDSAYFKDRMAEKSRICNVLIGKRISQEETEIIKIPKIKCLMPFIQSGVFGLGLPQIVELFLRSNFWDILKKIHMVFSRLLLFLILICRTNTYEMRIGRNPERSVEKLISFINRT